MRRLASIATVGLAIGLAGCYHATIETGLPPSNVVIDQPWALSFVYGIVPPATVSTAGKCTTGVSKVETQMSVVNSIVSILTAGILTPMSIKVTCASSGRAELPAGTTRIEVGSETTGEGVRGVFADAARIAAETEQAVYVMF